jgi:hypothetical protein
MQHSLSPALTGALLPGNVKGMKLSITSDLPLTPSSDDRFVTWLDVTARDGESTLAHARVGLVHIGEIADEHGDIWRALRAAKLEHLHDTYFEQGWYKDAFADGAGIDLLYIQDIGVDARVAGRNLELAIARRVSDTIGSGCQIVVKPYATATDAAHWSAIGFEISTPGRIRGLLHMKLGLRHARIVDTTGKGHFEVLGAGLPDVRPRRFGFGFQS